MITRNEQKIENTWNLEDIFPDIQAFEQTLDKEVQLSKEMMAYSHKIDDPKLLYKYICQLEKLVELIDQTYGYANLLADQDTSNSLHQQYLGKAYSIAVQVESEQSFFDVQLLEINDEQLKKAYEAEPRLQRFTRYIHEVRRQKAHTLSEKEEKILSSSQEALNASSQTYNILTNSNMTFEDVVDQDGQNHPLNSANYIDWMQKNDIVARKSAYEHLYDGYKKLGNTYASLLDGHMKQLKFMAQTKKYDSCLEASLQANDVNTSVYTTLIDTVHKNIGYLHKYMQLRKTMLKQDTLHMYDLYVPMMDIEKNVDFETAKQEVLDSVQIYGKEYTDTYAQGLNQRWIDIYPNKGKQSGAYSSGMLVHPYILLNHTDTLDSEFTLAHEMGHAMHSYLSNKHQDPLDRQYKIFVAEVASTCNEALLMDSLRKKSTDPKEQAYLINYFLEQYRTTLYRQTMFAEFELKCSQLVEQGQTLTQDVLNQIYHDLNVFYYGDDVEVDEYIDYEWMRIPHFYYNFYVYQYATGFSAAMALSKKMLQGNQDDVQAYLSFLQGGCSKSPIDLLKIAGVDLTSSQPIQEALDQFNTLIDAFEKLI